MNQTEAVVLEKMVEKGMVARDQVEAMVKGADETSLFAVLDRQGGLGEDQVSALVQECFGLSYVNLKKIAINKSVIDKVPLKIATYYKFVPVKIENRELTIAVAAPLDVKMHDDIRTYLGLDIKPVLAAEGDVADVLQHHYGLAAETVEQMTIGRSDPAEGQPVEKVEDLEQLAEDASVIKLVNQVLLEAYRRRATDVHIEPYRGTVRFRYRIDGILYDVKMPDEIRGFLNPILSRIKIIANMNIVEKRLPQDGRAVVKVHDQVLDLRISSIPTPYGESIVIRILPMQLLFDLEKLGMPSGYLDTFRTLIRRPHGIIFITGPTGSGKTTTLYACLSEINTSERKIITIEDPIEYETEGITQIQVNPGIGLDFARGLRSILRHDPNVVMVGEVRDLETAEIAIRASLTGHLVFSTLHTNDASSGVTRLVDIGVEPYLVASSLEAIVAQRLVRLICPDCKKEDNLGLPDIRRRIADDLNLPSAEDMTLFRGEGCEKCNGTGFFGRTAIYELFLFDEVANSLILNKASSAELKNQAISMGMRTLRQGGWEKVVAGLTTPEEVINVTPEDKKAAPRIFAAPGLAATPDDGEVADDGGTVETAVPEVNEPIDTEPVEEAPSFIGVSIPADEEIPILPDRPEVPQVQPSVEAPPPSTEEPPSAAAAPQAAEAEPEKEEPSGDEGRIPLDQLFAKKPAEDEGRVPLDQLFAKKTGEAVGASDEGRMPLDQLFRKKPAENEERVPLEELFAKKLTDAEAGPAPSGNAPSAMRRYERADKKINVSYKLMADESSRPGSVDEWSVIDEAEETPEVHTTTKDISGGGLMFYADTGIAMDAIMDMKIELPDGQPSLECLARVERVDEIKEGGIYGIGVCFLDMSNLDRTRMTKFIQDSA